MTELFSLISITSIWCLGITIITQPNMLLYSLRQWADKQDAWVEPIIRCHWCMPSIHSMIGYVIAFETDIVNNEFKWILAYPIVAMGASMLNGLIWGFHKYLEKKTEYYKYINESFKKMNDEKEQP